MDHGLLSAEKVAHEIRSSGKCHAVRTAKRPIPGSNRALYEISAFDEAGAILHKELITEHDVAERGPAAVAADFLDVIAPTPKPKKATQRAAPEAPAGTKRSRKKS